ncbi:MAG TPA: EI24 domain-containing protein [Rhizomicrobium sp.]|jgi:CysZ protein|nr:EI24 domain-containing protein [Rhizomicrobium sp.]
MFASVRKALATLLDRDFAGLILWTLVLTAVLFVLLFVGIEYGLALLPELGSIWVNRFLELATPIVLILAIFLLGAPVAAMVGSLFLERIAAKVDAHFYPNDPKAPGTPVLTGIGESFRLIGLALLLNVALLPVDVGVPGVAEIATVLANGWLLGREFFEMAALRHLSRPESDALRRRHGGKIYAAGLLISILTVIPALDLIAPFFGSALMAHLFKRLTRPDAAQR